VRLVETSRSRDDGRRAARYWWRFVRGTPTPLTHSGKAALIALAIAAVIALPPRALARLRAAAAALRGQPRGLPAPAASKP
jgi:hypothetical protein